MFIVFTLVREHEQARGVRGGCRAGTGAGIGGLPRSWGRSGVGVRPTKYTYWHSPGVGDNNATFDDTSIATGKTDGEDSAKSDKGPRRK